MKSIKYLSIIFLFIFYSRTLNAQNVSAEVDSLLAFALKATEKQHFEEAIIFAKRALVVSNEEKDEKSILESYYRIAHSLVALEKYQECLEIIILVDNKYKSTLIKNRDLNNDFQNLLGRSYLVLGFREQAVRTFLNELNISFTLTSKSKRSIMQARAYMSLASCYQSFNKDSVFYYMAKIKKLNQNELRSEQSLYFYNLAHYYLYYTTRIDSSFYYNNLGIKIDSANSLKYISVGLIQKANILYKQKQYSASLNTCMQFLPIVEKQKRVDYVLELYNQIALNYKSLGDNMKHAWYLDKMTHIKDSVLIVRKEAIETASKILVNDQLEYFRKNNRKTIIVSIFAFLIIGGILIFVLVQKRRLKYRKNKLLALKEEEVHTLENKLQNNSSEELVYLAKTDSADFLYRFGEIYPTFIAELLRIEPNLLVTELRFCAYLKLNFSTKEIATYTFVTTKAIQNRKNRLRKKLAIPSDEDINVWMSKIGVTHEN